MTAQRSLQDEAAQWVLRSEEPGWSEADQVQLDAWLAASTANKVAFWRLQHGWRAADRIGAIGAVADMPAPIISRFSFDWRRPIPAIAASLSFLLIVAVIVASGKLPVPFSPEPVRTIELARVETAIGGHKIVGLPDGSRVELNTATAIRAGVDKGRREVWLDSGEAYFDVAKDPARPFVVHAGSRMITVLGTKFSVRRAQGRVTIIVSEGRVRVDEVRGDTADRSATITTGNIAVAEGPTMLIADRSEDRVQEKMAWREGRLVFDGDTLGEAADEFNRYNRKQIVIADRDVAQMAIGGSFEAKNVDIFGRLLREAYGLKVTANEEKIYISR